MHNFYSEKSSDGRPHILAKWAFRIAIIGSTVAVLCMVFHNTSHHFDHFYHKSSYLPWPSMSSLSKPLPTLSSSPVVSSSKTWDGMAFVKNDTKLRKILRRAAMKDKTVIITTLNEAWAAPNSVLDLFVESLRIGNQTQGLLNHLVVIALDYNAYRRCTTLHLHCYFLTTKGIDFSRQAAYMTNIYLTMMWRRTNFLRIILEEGYNFLFTDADIMWFRDPFPRLFPDVDFQIACDNFNGNSSDKNNWPNGGFKFVRSNRRTIEFYRYWNASRERYPELNEQDILNHIKFDTHVAKIGLEMRFLSTDYFGGFCMPSKDFNLVCTMHANCCLGLDNKVKDVSSMLDDWRAYMTLISAHKATQHMSWTVPNYCRPPDAGRGPTVKLNAFDSRDKSA
ncbi:Nucleotide-diphospho-sugar transferase [Dillenia turbinata]|uniref:Nucleotide-diphospho-sugar transferase n=1 Tax=Dillenia turbinata TaxID=194707 RepID=A0AAN8V8F9_9MAGN